MMGPCCTRSWSSRTRRFARQRAADGWALGTCRWALGTCREGSGIEANNNRGTRCHACPIVPVFCRVGFKSTFFPAPYLLPKENRACPFWPSPCANASGTAVATRWWELVVWYRDVFILAFSPGSSLVGREGAAETAEGRPWQRLNGFRTETWTRVATFAAARAYGSGTGKSH